MELPKIPTMDEALEAAGKAAREAKDYLTEKGTALAKETGYFLSEDEQKEQVLNDRDEQNQTKPENAEKVLKIYQETKDIVFLRNYLVCLPPNVGPSLPPELQLQMAKEAERAYDTTNDTEKMEHRRTLCILNQTLPAVAQANLERYEKGVENHYESFDIRVPPYVSGLDTEVQKQIFDRNPLAYARTFPESQWVSGPLLDQIIEEDFDSRWNYMQNLNATSCGQVNYGEIPGSSRDMLDGHLLANKNLTNAQLKKVATQLVNCFLYQNKEGGIDPNDSIYVEQRGNVNRIAARLLAHPSVGADTVQQLKKIPVAFMGGENNRRLGREPEEV